MPSCNPPKVAVMRTNSKAAEPRRHNEENLLDRSILEALTRATSAPSLTLFQAGHETPHVLTRDELVTKSARLARHFRGLGMEPQDRVLLLLPTGLAFLTSLLGLWFNGAVSVPVVHRSTRNAHASWLEKVRRIMRISKARFVIGTEEALKSVAMLAGEAEAPVLLTDGEILQILRGRSEPALPDLPDSTAWAHCQFTSGTTGEPKGIMVRHDQITANLNAAATRLGVREGDRFLSWLPLHHDMGFIGGLLFPLHRQIPQVLLPTESFARAPHLWLDLITRHRVTLSPAPSFAFDLLATRIPDSRFHGVDLSSWRHAWIGAEPIFAKTLSGFRSRFQPYGLRDHVLAPCYGLAEATLAVSAVPSEQAARVLWVKRDPLQEEGMVEAGRESGEDSISIVGVGRPLSWAETRIVDDAGAPVGENREGRILVSGRCVCRSKVTAEGPVETGRWLDTGDLGFSRDGELFITGRAKDLLIRGGVNTHPHWVERVAETDSDVRPGRSAAVSIFRHDEGRQEIVLVIEPAGYPRCDVQELKRRLLGRISSEVGIQLDRVECVPPGTVPKTSSGKVQRRQMAAMLRPERWGRDVSEEKRGARW